MLIDREDLLQRFLSYVSIDTQSDTHSLTTPSTEKQWALLSQLEAELIALGLADVSVTEFGYVLATVPATSQKKNLPRVAFFAHVDTADACPGGATPIVHRNYQGQPIVLPDDPKQTLTLENCPDLKAKIGEDLVTASGKTLLGADDKAGVAIIMAAVRHMLLHPEIPHGPIRICFNPDEEIGRGVEKLPLEVVAADVAYTLDAESPGAIGFESFSADKAEVRILGVASHPGSAKDIMVNAIRLAAEFVSLLPMEFSPERTEDRIGFVHPVEISGTPEEVTVSMILRDFEMDGLEHRHRLVEEAAAKIRTMEPRVQVQVTFAKQYRNMRYWLEKDFRPVDFAREAIQRAGLTPFNESMRGGTDGSRLTERGLPTPNLFTGFHCIHSQREWVSAHDMARAAEVVVRLAQVWEEHH